MLLTAEDLPRLLDLARQADGLGADDLGMSEHVIMANKPETYPFGRYPHLIDEPWPEPMTTFGALAAVTRRVRLITTVVIAPLRPAVLLAKQAATLHALSRGRFVLGVSTSWQREEYDALGVPFEERGARLTDTVGACRALWADAPASFESPSVRFEGLYCIPRPGDAEAIPIWFGGALNPRLVRRVAQFGQGWMPFIGTEPRPLEMIARGAAQIHEAMRAAGRNPARLEVSALLMPRGRDLATALEEDVPAFQAAGVNHLRVQVSSFAPSLDAVPAVIAELVRRFEPFRR